MMDEQPTTLSIRFIGESIVHGKPPMWYEEEFSLVDDGSYAANVHFPMRDVIHRCQYVLDGVPYIEANMKSVKITEPHTTTITLTQQEYEHIVALATGMRLVQANEAMGKIIEQELIKVGFKKTGKPPQGGQNVEK